LSVLLQIFFEVLKNESAPKRESAGRSVGEMTRLPLWAGVSGLVNFGGVQANGFVDPLVKFSCHHLHRAGHGQLPGRPHY
jgi:hypothetical protein